MDEKEYNTKYTNLRILKSIQEYLKSESDATTSVYPINVPDELLLETLKSKGAKRTDELIHHIFKVGLNIWSENLYDEAFGSPSALKSFIEVVKKRNRKAK